ncbi:MAG: type I restriction enzyme HsdR N-terminal domain-containing protein [Oscillospiraceae bacterium]|nr:type I restriction enzyme HsdR N-terminal domain-containing protein [Oscillospiraceae bacterium]
MYNRLSSKQLPPIYKRKGKNHYLDPVRKKLIHITPEETVRQKVISYIIENLNVPAESIVVEQHLSHYGIKTKKRADIVIHKMTSDGNYCPICVIECKSPDVYLDDNARNQLLDYCDLIEADYAMMVNGVDCFCYKYDESCNNYVAITELPQYGEMLEDKYIAIETTELPERIPFHQLKSFLINDFSTYEDGFYGYEISSLTPIEKAVPAFNLLECLLDTRVKMPTGRYGMFDLVEDYGVRMIAYGNGSGGKFYGPYRSFLVNIDGNTEFYSITITTYSKSTNPENVKTCICVAHDDEETSHHALQLVVEDNIIVDGELVDFYHHGKIAVGRSGSGKVDGLRQLVEKRCPKLSKDNKFYLGRLKNDKLWRLDDSSVIELIENLISYSIIRDEYRVIVKNQNKLK